MKTWVKVLLVVAGVALLVGYIFYDAGQREARLTASATATLTAVDLHKDTESSSLDETRFRYRFETAGQAQDGNSALPGDRTGDFKPGQQVSICYDPSDPGESDIRTEADGPCGS